MFYHQGSGLYLTQYRVYEPRTGRWLSRDPIGEKGGLNLYAYVGGDPLSFSDSTGLSEEWDLCMKATGRADACRLPRGEDWRDVTVGPTAAGSASIGFTGYVTSIPEFSACMAASLLPDFATGKAMEVGLKEMTKAGGKAIGLMCKAVPVIGNISTGYDILQCYKESQVWTDYHPTGTYGWGR
jgi:RHS repeat-associated protein